MASSAMRRIDRGVELAGLTMTLLPSARAGAIFHIVVIMGKFQGTMQATTPIGSCTIMPTAPLPEGERRS